MKEYQNYINGKWVNSVSGKTFLNINPANTSDIIGHFQQSNIDDLEKASKYKNLRRSARSVF